MRSVVRAGLTSAIVIATGILTASAHAQSSQPTVYSGLPSLSPWVTDGTGSPPSVYGWAGTWLTDQYVGGYIGAIKALNDKGGLWADGFLLRISALGGRYSYLSSTLSDVRVNMHGADIMLGYRARLDTATFNVYVGPSYETHVNSDSAATIRGTRVGAKLLADYSNKLSPDWELYAQASISSAFLTYSATARVLYQVADKIWFGPQVTLYGNEAPFQEGTAGALIKRMTDFGEIGLSAGYRYPFVTSGGFSSKDGYFASVYLGVPFR